MNATKSTYAARRAETLTLRAQCAQVFLPLFDRCVTLADDSHRHGNAQRAGRELAHARKVAGYLACKCGRPAITGSELCSAHNPDCWRVYDNGGKTVDRYTVCVDDGDERWEGNVRFVTCLGVSVGGVAYSEFAEAQEGRHLGKRMKFSALDAATRAHIESRLTFIET